MITKEQVLLWADLGFHMRRLVKNGKVPQFKGSFDQGDTLQDLLGWIKEGGNLGVITGALSGIVCIDIDVHNGVNGLENLKNYMYCQNHEPLPETRTIKSPTGGLHLYYKLPDEYMTRRFLPTHEEIEAVDFRNHSQFMVLEGSERPEGTYEVLKDIAFKDVPQCPSWVLELYVKEHVEKTANNGKMTYIAKKLMEWATPVESGNRNNYMTSVVGFLILQNLPIEKVYTWASIINVNFVSPSLPDDEMNQIINSVLRRELIKRNV